MEKNIKTTIRFRGTNPRVSWNLNRSYNPGLDLLAIEDTFWEFYADNECILINEEEC